MGVGVGDGVGRVVGLGVFFDVLVCVGMGRVCGLLG